MTQHPPIYMVYSTFADRKEAIAISKRLLESKLIACANIIDNMASVYQWNSEIQEEKEVLLLAKTTEDKVPSAIAFITTHHSYELPCVMAYRAEAGNPSYLEWVAAQTQD
ncbi:MAG: divalent-cation tolerance protein CutA [Rickettsiales bacterium]|nr:divalent-cation tolerance protein CutA [Rickettsiales bacterium]